MNTHSSTRRWEARSILCGIMVSLEECLHLLSTAFFSRMDLDTLLS